MSTLHLMAFLSATALLHVTPGPIMLMLFQQTLRLGFAGGFKTYLGVSLGEIGLVSAVSAGLLAATELAGDVMLWLSRAGVVFLIYCAVSAWRDSRGSRESGKTAIMSGQNSFLTGLATALSNPATLLFYAAFFPQFIDRTEAAAPQIVMLALLYTGFALCFDLACVGAAAKPCAALRSMLRHAFISRMSAVAYSAIALSALIIWR
jgi:homoserine/homoserine lactone efflux protein